MLIRIREGDEMLIRARTRWVALGVMLAALLSVATIQPASAATSRRVTVSNNSIVCVQGVSAFNWITPTGGFQERSAQASTFALNRGSCIGTRYRPSGQLAVRLQVYKLVGSQWALCRSYGWKFGGGGDTRSGDIINPQVAVDRQYYTSPPCGPGLYGTLGRHYVWNGTAWQGGRTWSGPQSAA